MTTWHLFRTTILAYATNISLLDHCNTLQTGLLDFALFSKTQQTNRLFKNTNHVLPLPPNPNLLPSPLKVKARVLTMADRTTALASTTLGTLGCTPSTHWAHFLTKRKNSLYLAVLAA